MSAPITKYNQQIFRNKLNDIRRLMIMQILSQLAEEKQCVTVAALHALFNVIMEDEFQAEPMKWGDFLHMWNRNCEGAWSADDGEQHGYAKLTDIGAFRLCSAGIEKKKIEFIIIQECQRGNLMRTRKSGTTQTYYQKLKRRHTSTLAYDKDGKVTQP